MIATVGEILNIIYTGFIHLYAIQALDNHESSTLESDTVEGRYGIQTQHTNPKSPKVPKFTIYRVIIVMPICGFGYGFP